MRSCVEWDVSASHIIPHSSAEEFRHGDYACMGRLWGWHRSRYAGNCQRYALCMMTSDTSADSALGLGAGYAPIGAVLMSKKVARGIRYCAHGHTYQASCTLIDAVWRANHCYPPRPIHWLVLPRWQFKKWFLEKTCWPIAGFKEVTWQNCCVIVYCLRAAWLHR